MLRIIVHVHDEDTCIIVHVTLVTIVVIFMDISYMEDGRYKLLSHSTNITSHSLIISLTSINARSQQK